MAVQDAGDVIAIIDADELAAERIPITMLEEDLLADVGTTGVEIHGQVFAVEGQAGERDALRRALARHRDRRRITDDFGRVGQGLSRIPELQPAQLRG